MKLKGIRLIIILIIFFVVKTSYGQRESSADGQRKTSIATVGFLQGGGALFGIDLEQLITSNIGISLGMGFLAYGGSIHYHIKPRVNSSSIAFNYWHQGFGSNHVQTIVGPTYVFRMKRLLSFQLGMGGVIDKGPNYANAFGTQKEELLLLYSLGFYF